MVLSSSSSSFVMVFGRRLSMFYIIDDVTFYIFALSLRFTFTSLLRHFIASLISYAINEVGV